MTSGRRWTVVVKNTQIMESRIVERTMYASIMPMAKDVFGFS